MAAQTLVASAGVREPLSSSEQSFDEQDTDTDAVQGNPCSSFEYTQEVFDTSARQLVHGSSPDIQIFIGHSTVWLEAPMVLHRWHLRLNAFLIMRAISIHLSADVPRQHLLSSGCRVISKPPVASGGLGCHVFAWAWPITTGSW